MLDTVLLLLVLLVLVVLGVRLWAVSSASAPVAAPSPVVPAPMKSLPKVTVRLVSAEQRVLGHVTIPAASRRPMLRHRTADGIGVFMADHQDGQDWVYRRVAVEPEYRSAHA